MSLRTAHLRKLLQLFGTSQKKRISLLRADIRQDIAKLAGPASGGGDFYMPFWKDAKDHTVGSADLEAATALRMAANEARSNLYPQLKDGFLAWWDERRRWTNAPFEPIESPRASYVYRPLNVTIKIDNILAIRDFGGKDHFVYPYFYPEPALSESIARIGLWMLGRALPSASWEEIRLLDVIRGESFSVERLPLLGNEELNFIKNYTELHRQWTEIRDDYPT